MSRRMAGCMLVMLLLMAGASCSKKQPSPYPREDFLYSETGSMLPVVFSHARHLSRGLTCDSCHPAIFETRRGMADATKRLNMKSIYGGEYCGVCHNGKKAFGLEKCSGCHVGSHM